MNKQHLPSIEALTSTDDHRWIRELCVLSLREQVAVARALLDEVEALAPLSVDGHPSPEGQVAEDLMRLGCRMVEMASTLSRVPGEDPTPRRGEAASAAEAL